MVVRLGSNLCHVRQQRWGLALGVRSGAGFGQVIQHIALLLTQGRDDGQNAFYKAGPVVTVCAETASPPDDASPQSALGGVVRRFDPCLLHEGPQRPFDFEIADHVQRHEVAAQSGSITVPSASNIFSSVT